MLQSQKALTKDNKNIIGLTPDQKLLGNLIIIMFLLPQKNKGTRKRLTTMREITCNYNNIMANAYGRYTTHI